MIFDYTLPKPYDYIIICCEKDAAYRGVRASAGAMGAKAVYSGGGKSSRSGIEKMFYKGGFQDADHIYVLVISDWDTDGESVIAPTFVNQLSTYMDRDLIEYLRVGITPEQLEQFGYTFRKSGTRSSTTLASPVLLIT